MADDIARIELERIVFGAVFREHDRRIERTQSARRAVRHKVDVGKPFGIAAEIGRRRRVFSRKYLLRRRWKMSGYAFHLGCGLRELGIFIARSNAVADEEQCALSFLRRGRAT